MTLPGERSYQFRLAAQWEAGVRSNLELRDDRLLVPDQLVIEPLRGAGRLETGALPAWDAYGHLVWLRPGSRQLVRRPFPWSFGVIEVGTLDGDGPAQKLVVGPHIIWVLGRGVLDRYDVATLQRLGSVERVAGWWASDAAGDGADGLWLAEGNHSGSWRLRHVDCWGRSCRAPVALTPSPDDELALTSTPDEGLAVTSTPDGRRLVAILAQRATTAYVVDASRGIQDDRIDLDPVHRGGGALLAATTGDRVHLLTPTGADTAVYQLISLARGDVEDHQHLQVPGSVGPPTALAAGPAGLVVAGPGGLGCLRPEPQGGTRPRRSTYVTPALTSPLGSRAGWNRAEVGAVLPPGTVMEISWAATESRRTIDAAAKLFDGPRSAGLVDQLDRLLPWRETETVTYRGTDHDNGEERLAALLDGVAEHTLWLRIRLHTPPGRTPPTLVSLRVRYPEASYLDHLPAVYREDENAAQDLRRILAPYEMLFDGLDETLASLSGRTDPASADDRWSDYLLSWLGFPPLGDLPAHIRRGLLEQASVLLEQRGTRAGLERLLDLVTEGRSTVRDPSDEPCGWFLGAGDLPSAGGSPARLGHDTMVLAQRPEPARPGTMVLGRTPLGQGCPDPALMLAQRAATVTIELELDHQQQHDLGPIIDRLARFFVPAHCRLRVVSTGADSADRSRQLDVDLRLGSEGPIPDPGSRGQPDARLHGDAHWRLGVTTRLGVWPLSAPHPRPARLDYSAHGDAGLRLH